MRNTVQLPDDIRHRIDSLVYRVTETQVEVLFAQHGTRAWPEQP